MTLPIRMVLPIEPKAKGRGRIIKRGKFASIKTPDETVVYETSLAQLAQQYMPPEPIEGLLAVSALFVFARPKYMQFRYKRTGEYKYGKGLLPHGAKPDVDNCVKALLDALKRWIPQDERVVEVTACKAYAEIGGMSRVVVRVDEWNWGSAGLRAFESGLKLADEVPW